MTSSYYRNDKFIRTNSCPETPTQPFERVSQHLPLSQIRTKGELFSPKRGLPHTPCAIWYAFVRTRLWGSGKKSGSSPKQFREIVRARSSSERHIFLLIIAINSVGGEKIAALEIKPRCRKLFGIHIPELAVGRRHALQRLRKRLFHRERSARTRV